MYQGLSAKGILRKKETKPSCYAPRLGSQHPLYKSFEPKGFLENWTESNVAIRINTQINFTSVFTVEINKMIMELKPKP